MNRGILAALLAAQCLLGCEANQECEKSRFELAKSWEGLRSSASRRKLAGVDVEGWKFVETRADLLESSFATTKVTWNSADRAKGEIIQRVNALQTDNPANLTGYKLSLDAALKAQEAYGKMCR